MACCLFDDRSVHCVPRACNIVCINDHGTIENWKFQVRTNKACPLNQCSTQDHKIKINTRALMLQNTTGAELFALRNEYKWDFGAEW